MFSAKVTFLTYNPQSSHYTSEINLFASKWARKSLFSGRLFKSESNSCRRENLQSIPAITCKAIRSPPTKLYVNDISHLQIVKICAAAAQYQLVFLLFFRSAQTFYLLAEEVLIDFVVETSFWHRKWVLRQGWVGRRPDRVHFMRTTTELRSRHLVCRVRSGQTSSNWKFLCGRL